ncbi:hypothetical protein MBLNU457_g2801t1 [Dothideomycetes sp. NU457]
MDALRTRKRPLKTYSRSKKRKLEDEETPIQRSQRRRVTRDWEEEEERGWKGLLPGPGSTGKVAKHQAGDLQDFSSSSDPIRYSDDARDSRTPPSSPPPLLSPLDSSEDCTTRVDTSCTTIRPALKGINGNARITSFFAAPIPRKTSIDDAPNPRKQVLIQSQINLGLTSQKTCKTCGMTYVPSNAEDSALHAAFHGQSIDGAEITKNFRRHYEKSALWRGNNNDIVIRVEMHQNIWHRKRMESILEVVTRELGAVVIPTEELTSTIGLIPRSKEEPRRLTTSEGQKSMTYQDDVPYSETQLRYQAYLYLSGTKCVGVCLTERLLEAYEVLPTCEGPATSDSPITVSDIPSPATIGISRIWTSKSYRGKGIAVAMLNSVVTNSRIERVPKDMVAFSQPTTSGARLARKWFGKEHGWLVYKA